MTFLETGDPRPALSLAHQRDGGVGRGRRHGRSDRRLVVGDSVRESLRDMTLDRLGRIDEAPDLAITSSAASWSTSCSSNRDFKSITSDAVGVMLFPQATVERPSDSG